MGGILMTARVADARWIVVACLAFAGCTGSIRNEDPFTTGSATLGASGAVAPGTSGVVASTSMLGLGANGITRLSREEYRSTVRSLLGVEVTSDVELLPADSFTPFDNDYTLQVPSKALVDGLKAVAERSLDKVLADPALRSRLVGCVPSAAADTQCLSDFIRRFGRRALRRPLADAEVQAYLQFQ